METEYDEPVLCNYYDTFSPYIDLTEKYKFVSTTELYNIMKEKSTDFSLRKGWIINTFNDNPNFSFDTPLKVRNLIEKYTLNKSSNRLSSIGSTEWIHLQECKLSELSEKSEVTKIAKKAINDIAKIENVSDVNDIFSYCCKSILSPEGARLPFFENVVNNYLQKNILSSSDNYNIIPTQTFETGINSILTTMFFNHILSTGDLVGVITPCNNYTLEMIPNDLFSLKVSCISMEENGMILESEFEKIKNPDLKLLIVANSSNISLSTVTCDKIQRTLLESKPELIIIQDTSYVQFSDKIVNLKGPNVISIYSYKKFFGNGNTVIAVPKNNIIDTVLINYIQQDDDFKESIKIRYIPANSKLSQINFAQKILLDTLNISCRDTTSVISHYDQLLLCLYSVIEYNKYKQSLIKLLDDRQEIFKHNLGLNELPTNNFYTNLLQTNTNCNFYLIINLIKVANSLYGNDEFGEYIFKNHNFYELFFDIAGENGLILIPGTAFNLDPWDLRIPIGSLSTQECGYIGMILKHRINRLYEDFKVYNKKLENIKFGL